jgi:hypothetical protein
MKRDYGKVTFNGKEYTLQQDAYADNYMDRICYFATAADSEGNNYKVMWELKDPENYAELEDESEACDWDDAAEVNEW